MSLLHSESFKAPCKTCKRPDVAVVRRVDTITHTVEMLLSRHLVREGRGFCLGSLTAPPPRGDR